MVITAACSKSSKYACVVVWSLAVNVLTALLHDKLLSSLKMTRFAVITKMVIVFAHIYTKCCHKALLGGTQVQCSVGEDSFVVGHTCTF